MLTAVGLKPYATYGKWVSELPVLTGVSSRDNFVFVVPAFRGLGLSRLLHNTLYKKYAHEKVRYAAWIGENNERSIELHKSFNYKKWDHLKVTFLREADR